MKDFQTILISVIFSIGVSIFGGAVAGYVFIQQPNMIGYLQLIFTGSIVILLGLLVLLKVMKEK